MKNENTLDRRLEISSKLLEMGQALMKEGDEKRDFCIKQNGSFIILMSGLILDEDDTYEFGSLCSMFSAKKILSSVEKTDSDMGDFLNNGITKSSDDLKNNIEDFIKRMRGKKGGGDTPKE